MDPSTIPTAVRRTLRAACDGDWDRVTRDDDGSYTVHNQPVVPVVEIDEKPSRVRIPCPWDKAAEPDVVPSAPPPVVDLTRVRPRPPRAAGLTVAQPQRPTLAVEAEPLVSPAPPAEFVAAFDWAEVELNTAVSAVHARCLHGVPSALRYTYLPDVLALYGVDFDLLDAALRNPTKVEIRPESAEKHYAVLAFFRGDLQVIVGFREPASPKVIAVYVTSLIENDTYRVKHVGGGGAKRTNGLPRTAKAVMAALAARGADIDDPGLDGATALVRYHGQELGRVSVGKMVPRATAESDYQRILRKMQAIDSRAEAAV